MGTDSGQKDITEVGEDAAKEDGASVGPEVSLYFQNRLFRANRTQKFSAEELSAFASFNYPALADVGVGIHSRYGVIAKPEGVFSVDTSVSNEAAIVKVFPGLTEPLLRTMLSAEGLRGVILETYGAGNAPTFGWFIRTLEEAIRRGVHIIHITQCASGPVNMEIYKTVRRLHDLSLLHL